MNAQNADTYSSDSDLVIVEIEYDGTVKDGNPESNLEASPDALVLKGDEIKENVQSEEKRTMDNNSMPTNEAEHDKPAETAIVVKEDDNTIKQQNFDLANEIQVLTARHNAALIQLEGKYKVKIGRLDEEVEDLKTGNANLIGVERELELLRKSHEEEKQHMEASLEEQKLKNEQELLVREEKFNEENSRIKTELNEALDEVKRLTLEKEESEKVLLSQKSEIDDLSSKAKTSNELEKRNLELEKELENRDNEIVHLTSEVQTNKQTVNEQHMEVEGLRGKLVEVQNSSKEIEKEHGSKVEALQEQLRKSNQELIERDNVIGTLRLECDGLKKNTVEEKDEYGKQLKVRDIEIGELRTELEASVKAKELSDQELAERDNIIGELRLELQTSNTNALKQKELSEQDLSKRECDISKLQSEIELLRSSVKTKEQTEQELQNALEVKTEIEQELTKRGDLIGKLRSEVDVLQASSKEQKTIIADQKSQYEKLQESLKELKQGRLVVKIYFTEKNDLPLIDIISKSSARELLVSTKQSVGVLKQQLQEALKIQGFPKINSISTFSEDHKLRQLNTDDDMLTVEQFGLTDSTNVLVVLGKQDIGQADEMKMQDREPASCCVIS